MTVVRHSNTCPTCGGSGWERATDMGKATMEPCATCDGDGRVVGVRQLDEAERALREFRTGLTEAIQWLARNGGRS